VLDGFIDVENNPSLSEVTNLIFTKPERAISISHQSVFNNDSLRSMLAAPDKLDEIRP
jgi:hypothetical protein